MSPIEANAAVTYIRELFVNLKPATIEALMRELVDKAYQLDAVKAFACEMRKRPIAPGSDPKMFEISELVAHFRPEAKIDPALSPGQSAWRRQNQKCEAQLAANAADMAQIQGMSDEDLAELQAEVIAKLPADIRPMFAARDPRTSKALGLAIAQYVNHGRVPA